MASSKPASPPKPSTSTAPTEETSMRQSEIALSLETMIAARRPVFLWGSPGVGKSQTVAQVAAKAGIELRDVRAVQFDPVDLRGLPRIDSDGRTHWSVPDFLPRDGAGVLFLDELNAADRAVQAACYQLVLDRRLGEYALPDGWTVVAAGNNQSDRAVTNRMSTALASRFVHLEYAVHLDDWCKWAVEHDLPPELIAFIRFRPNLLHAFDPQSTERTFPCPRTWEFMRRSCGRTRRRRSSTNFSRARSAAAPRSNCPGSCASGASSRRWIRSSSTRKRSRSPTIRAPSLRSPAGWRGARPTGISTGSWSTPTGCPR